MVSLLQDDAIYFCANLGCLKLELRKEKVKRMLLSILTEVLVHSYKCLSDIFMKRVPGLQKSLSVSFN